MSDEEAMRLQKYLARAGVASRRACEAIILDGRVVVNGQQVTELGVKVIPGKDKVTLDEQPIFLKESHVVLMLNKPKGYLTSMSDPFARPCVSDLIPFDLYPGIFPIGRLDFNTSGLLLFTTDGELGHRLLHPSKHVNKTYIAQVSGNMGEKACKQLRSGVMLDDGMTSPATVEILVKAKRSTMVSITIHEGRKRQIRRMCEAVGHPVRELKRISFGSLELGNLSEGSYRELTFEEYSALCNNKVSL